MQADSLRSLSLYFSHACRHILIVAGLFLSIAASAPLALAADPLGSVSALQVSCASVRGQGGVPGGTCYRAVVSCPEIADIPVAVKVNEPRQSSIGTILFTVGGGGLPWYDVHFRFGTKTIQDVLAAGYTTVQFNFQYPPVGGSSAPPTGWLTGPGGPRALACRWVSLAQWTHDHIRRPNTAFCATGNSAGAAAAAYGLAHYGMGAMFDMLEQTSGPPFSRIDDGCLCNKPPVKTPCVRQSISACYLREANTFLDPAYESRACSRAVISHRSPFEAIFLHDSLNAPDATSFYPNTDIHFVFGGRDDTPGAAQATLWLQQISGRNDVTVDCVADAPHEIADVVDGAQKIADDLINFCH
jgi:hypothetical protein